MKKYTMPFYFIIFLFQAAILGFFTMWQIGQYAAWDGIHLGVLAWSMYILCIPALHGAIIFAVPVRLLLNKFIITEPYCWSTAVVVNILSIIFTPQVYQKTIITYVLYRTITVSQCWPILLIAAIGAWYRIVFVGLFKNLRPQTHTIIRHLVFICGVFSFFYLAHQELIIMLNASATG